MKDSLLALGAVASLRAALSTAHITASGWSAGDADLKQWLERSLRADREFHDAMLADTSETKRLVEHFLPGIAQGVSLLLESHISLHAGQISLLAKVDAIVDTKNSRVTRLQYESLQEIEQIGQGAYGSIHKMRCTELGDDPVAVKKLISVAQTRQS